tara:strand:- start:143 stop:247 length:105 start_codon:yes stop_codon:yes gene_type:complete
MGTAQHFISELAFSAGVVISGAAAVYQFVESLGK